MKLRLNAFSLIEVVISLGIFTFCIIGVVGLLPIASNAVKSVSLESSANNVAESISGIWQVAPVSAIPVSIPLGGNRTMGNFTIGPAGPDNQPYYYDNDGRITNSVDASFRLDYAAAPLSVNTFTVNLTFTWPPNASGNSTTANKRTFNYIFAK
jgi:hypothetical protein